MHGRCVVGGCSNRNDPERNISLHKIPCYGNDRTEGKAQRKGWVDFVKLKRAKWEPTAASRVCSVHFSNSEDFEAQFSIPGFTSSLLGDEKHPQVLEEIMSF